MRIGATKERANGERRVAVSPDLATSLTQAGHQVAIESGCGESAGFADEIYTKSGCEVDSDVGKILASSDLLLKVQKPLPDEIDHLTTGSALVAILDARRDAETVNALANAGVTAFAMELVPRIARAQSMDVLSSQASIAGYKAALMAADSLSRFFPMMMTAAGTLPPARVLVIGAGVAGLQAIATAKRLGAEVFGFDVRAAAGEQVESLGARFIPPPDVQDAEGAGGYAREQTTDENQRQRDYLAEHVERADVVITTAAIPGRQAPLLVESATVKRMRPGSVIIDLAAETGGNVEATVAGEDTDVKGVKVLGPMNVPSMMPYHASMTYARNLRSLLDLIIDADCQLALDFDDEIIDAMCVTHDGAVRGHTICREED